RISRRHGAQARVVFCEHGDITGLVAAARGVVTVNSTTGALALGAGVPVICLGRAIYDLPGLTFQGGLEAFWRAPEPPHATLYAAFRRVLEDRCVVRGGLYSDRGVALFVAGALARLTSAPVAAERRAEAA